MSKKIHFNGKEAFHRHKKDDESLIYVSVTPTCGNNYPGTGGITDNVFEVTCKTCLNTRLYKYALIDYKIANQYIPHIHDLPTLILYIKFRLFKLFVKMVTYIMNNWTKDVLEYMQGYTYEYDGDWKFLDEFKHSVGRFYNKLRNLIIS